MKKEGISLGRYVDKIASQSDLAEREWSKLNQLQFEKKASEIRRMALQDEIERLENIASEKIEHPHAIV